MRQGLQLLVFALLLGNSDLQAQAISGRSADSSNTPASVVVNAYPQSNASVADTLNLHKGDSLFLYDGALYFRARANGADFFIPREKILSLAESLVIYQNLRIMPSATKSGSSDGIELKAVRKQCSTITKNGARCKRLAQAGSDKCWQHQK